MWTERETTEAATYYADRQVVSVKEVPQIEWVPVESKDDLGKTGRNGGFGHTGVS